MTTRRRRSSVPPRPVRRLLLGPIVPVVATVGIVVLPIGAAVGVFATRFLPGPLKPVRLLWVMLVGLARESVGITASVGVGCRRLAHQGPGGGVGPAWHQANALVHGYTPTASGKQQRHRLNRGGDRRAVIDRAHPVGTNEETKLYMKRRIAEGKTKKEVFSCLKRYIAREVHKTLVGNPLLRPA